MTRKSVSLLVKTLIICLHISICFICPSNYHDDSLLFWSARINEKKLHNVTCCGCFLLLCLFSFSRLLDDLWWWLLKFIVSFTKTKSMQRRYKISNLSNTSIMKLMVHLFRLFGIMSSIKYNKLNLQDLSSWFYSFNSTVFDMNEKFLVIWWTLNWRMRPNTDLI